MRVSTQMSEWATHLPTLLEMLGRTSGPVLELGGGRFSTPTLHSVMADVQRPLMTAEPDEGWWQVLRELERPWHKVVHARSWDRFFETWGLAWDLVFVDCGDPADEAGALAGRQALVARFRDLPTTVVMHDADAAAMQWTEEWKELVRSIRWKRFDDLLSPATLVLSNVVELRSNACQ